jgi:DNA-binding NtrC family response regulator
MADVPSKVLLVDDDADMQEILQIVLPQWGFQTKVASNAAEAKAFIESYRPDLVLSDVVLPDISGLDLLRSLQANDPNRPVILITGYSTVDMAVEAMKRGAHDFLTKPLDYPKLKSVLEDVQRNLRLRKKSKKLLVQLTKGAGFGPFVGTSPPMRELYKLIQTVGATDTSALIYGESGTGKELVARTLHAVSARADHPFIALNMAAIPKDLVESQIFGFERGAFTGAESSQPGYFEMANEGTLFLDEIAEMSPELQSKLLRVLEDRRIRRVGGSEEVTLNVRVIAATNHHPKLAVEEGRLRPDLFFRLNVFPLMVPPLRDRKDDVSLLAHHFVQEFNQKHELKVEGVREDSLRLLKRYSWPGNVRELKNAIERAVIVCGRLWIKPWHLPPYIANPTREVDVILPQGVSTARVQRELVLRTLEKVGYRKAEAARLLGLDVKTVSGIMKALGAKASQR